MRAACPLDCPDACSLLPIPGTVVLEGTWWEAWAPDGKGINHLTSEALTDLGGGSTFHSTPVEVELLPQDPLYPSGVPMRAQACMGWH